MIVSQIVFILLTFTLLQIYLLRNKKKREKLGNKPMPEIRKKLLTTEKYVIVYYQGKFAFLRRSVLIGNPVAVKCRAKIKALKKTQKLRLESDDLWDDHSLSVQPSRTPSELNAPGSNSADSPNSRHSRSDFHLSVLPLT